MPADLLKYLDPFLLPNSPSKPFPTPLSTSASALEPDAHEILNCTAASAPAPLNAANCSHNSDSKDDPISIPKLSAVPDPEQANDNASVEDAHLSQHRKSVQNASAEIATSSQFGTPAETKPCSNSRCTASDHAPEEEHQACKAQGEVVGDHANACSPEHQLGDRSGSADLDSWLQDHTDLPPQGTGYAASTKSQQKGQSSKDSKVAGEVVNNSIPQDAHSIPGMSSSITGNAHSKIADIGDAVGKLAAAGDPAITLCPQRNEHPYSSGALTAIVPPVKMPPVPFDALQPIGKLLPIETPPLPLGDLPSIGTDSPTRQLPLPLDDLPCAGIPRSSGGTPMPHGNPNTRLSGSPPVDSALTAVSEPQQAANKKSKHSCGTKAYSLDQAGISIAPNNPASAAAAAYDQADVMADKQATAATNSSSSSSSSNIKPSDSSVSCKAAITVATRGPRLPSREDVEHHNSSTNSSVILSETAVSPAVATNSPSATEASSSQAKVPASVVVTDSIDSSTGAGSSSVKMKPGCVRKATSSSAGSKPQQFASPFDFTAAAQAGSRSSSTTSGQKVKSSATVKQERACGPAHVSVQFDSSSAHSCAHRDGVDEPEQTKSRGSLVPSPSNCATAQHISRDTSTNNAHASKECSFKLGNSDREELRNNIATSSAEPAVSAVSGTNSSWSHANVSRTKPSDISASSTSASLSSSFANTNSCSANPSNNSASLSNTFADPNRGSANSNSSCATRGSSFANTTNSTSASLTGSCSTLSTSAANSCFVKSRCRLANPSNGSIGVDQSGDTTNVKSKTTSKRSKASYFDFKRCFTSSHTTLKRHGHESCKPSQAASQAAFAATSTPAQPLVSEGFSTDACLHEAQPVFEPPKSLTSKSGTDTTIMSGATNEDSLNTFMQDNLEQALAAAASKDFSPEEISECDDLTRQAIDSGNATQVLSASARVAAIAVQRLRAFASSTFGF